MQLSQLIPSHFIGHDMISVLFCPKSYLPQPTLLPAPQSLIYTFVVISLHEQNNYAFSTLSHCVSLFLAGRVQIRFIDSPE